MTFSTLFSFLTYALIISYTPGPANLFSFNVSSQYGFHTFKKVWAGLFSAFVLDMLCCCLLTFGFSQIVPTFTRILTYVGSIYILWLAWHIFSSTQQTNSHSKNDDSLNGSDRFQKMKKNPTFLVGFFLNLTNVKIILYGLTIYQIYFIPNIYKFHHLLFMAIPIAMLGASSCFFWAMGGRLFSHLFTKYEKICNTIMALLLVWCVIKILFC